MIAAIFGILFIATVASGQNYCAICSDHTMCKYSGVGPNCAPKLLGGVSAADKTAVLNAHNAFRQKVASGLETRGLPGPQPQAANMRLMVWNDELATVAQRWADQCSFGHDNCRKVTQFSVGQNVFMASTTGTPGGPNWSQAITAFYDEVKDFNPTWIQPFKFAANIGHYTQVAWATSYSIGCGYTVFKKPGDNTWTNQYYVCNYGPAGNYINDVMYKKGAPCSQCPTGTSCRTSQYPALCS